MYRKWLSKSAWIDAMIAREGQQGQGDNMWHSSKWIRVNTNWPKQLHQCVHSDGMNILRSFMWYLSTFLFSTRLHSLLDYVNWTMLSPTAANTRHQSPYCMYNYMLNGKYYWRRSMLLGFPTTDCCRKQNMIVESII